MESLTSTTLEESIYATVAYFDLFDYPLTPDELWTFLIYPPKENPPLETVLAASSRMNELEWDKGFLFLRGNQRTIQTRIDRYLIAERKYRKAFAFSRLCALVPGVAMIAVCNTLAFSHSRDESDIDIVIVARKGYLWFVRAASIVISLAFGRRLSLQHTRDALCLSFFISDEAFDLSCLRVPDRFGIGDVYLAVWVSRCVPLYAERGYSEAFWEANRWSERIVPHRRRYLTNHMRRVEIGTIARIAKQLMTLILLPFHRGIESACKAHQYKKFPPDIRAKTALNGTDVVVSDTMLKFHLTDRRTDIQHALCERLQSYRSRCL